MKTSKQMFDISLENIGTRTYVSLQMGEIEIYGGLSRSSEFTDLPSEWFCRLKNDRPAIGRENGILHLTKSGYAANREAIFAFVRENELFNEQEFDRQVQHQFGEIKKCISKKVEKLSKAIKSLQEFVV